MKSLRIKAFKDVILRIITCKLITMHLRETNKDEQRTSSKTHEWGNTYRIERWRFPVCKFNQCRLGAQSDAILWHRYFYFEYSLRRKLKLTHIIPLAKMVNSSKEKRGNQDTLFWHNTFYHWSEGYTWCSSGAFHLCTRYYHFNWNISVNNDCILNGLNSESWAIMDSFRLMQV